MPTTLSSEEFNKLLSALVRELVDAQIHFKLYKDLESAKAEYGREFLQSWTFWSLTFQAHIDATLLRLCKAYDQYDKGSSLNLHTFLREVQNNVHLFDEAFFRDRLKDNEFVDSLADSPRRPKPDELEADFLLVGTSNPQVKKLTVWRNNYFSHLSLAQARDSQYLTQSFPLLFDDIQSLLTNGLTIVNKYSNLFIATTHSTNMVGRNDYKYVLKSLKVALELHEARIQEEIQKWTTPSKTK